MLGGRELGLRVRGDDVFYALAGTHWAWLKRICIGVCCNVSHYGEKSLTNVQGV